MSIHVNILITCRVHMLFILYNSTRAHGYLPKQFRLFTACNNRLSPALFIKALLNCSAVMVVATDHSLSTFALTSIANRKHVNIKSLKNHINLPALGIIWDVPQHMTHMVRSLMKLFAAINDLLFASVEICLDWVNA